MNTYIFSVLVHYYLDKIRVYVFSLDEFEVCSMNVNVCLISC